MKNTVDTSKRYDFAVIGGDERQVYLKTALARRNYRVCEYALCTPSTGPNRSLIYSAGSLKEAVCFSKTILLPIPMNRADGSLNHRTKNTDLSTDLLLDVLSEGQTLYAGCIPGFFLKAAWQKGVGVYDYMQQEELTIYNSIATAEGAVAEAIGKSSCNLHKSRCLVLGYGRCGKTLSFALTGLSCRVTVCARSQKARAEADLTVSNTVDIAAMRQLLAEYDFIFNTIPEQILREDDLSHINPDAVIIDLASSPGGMDHEAAKRLGLHAWLCPGLPGKYAPKSSAEAMAEIILRSNQI